MDRPAEELRVDSLQGQGSCFSLQHSICGAQKWVPGAFSPRVKLPKRESDLSSPSRDEVKNGWRCSSTSLYICS
jgi:hypothetical protein